MNTGPDVRHDVLVDGEIVRGVPSEERALEVKAEYETNGKSNVTIQPSAE